MRKADFAELVLSMVANRDRAVSIVGDLLERDEAGWLNAVRTTENQIRKGYMCVELALLCCGALLSRW